MKAEKRILRYLGSKLNLLDFIHFVVNKEIKEKFFIVGDLFAGSGIVGISFKRKGYKIVSNDLQYLSFVLNKKFIGINDYLYFYGLEKEIPNLLNYDPKKRTLLVLNYLNNLKEYKKGFIFDNYCIKGTKGKEFERMYFSDENALRIDTIRQKIEEWFIKKLITEDEYFYLLGTLIQSADEVANTTGKYDSFLKKLEKNAQKKLMLKYDDIIFSDKKNVVFNDDVLNILNKEKIDLLYLDPPYTDSQYDRFYHVLETIARYDNPKIHGKTGLRFYEKQKSDFSSKRKVKEAFKKLIKRTNAKYILISYNNEGLLSLKEIQELLSLRGEPKTYFIKYKRYKSNNFNQKANFTYEYLHFVKCVKNINAVKEKNFPIIEVNKDILKQVSIKEKHRTLNFYLNNNPIMT